MQTAAPLNVIWNRATLDAVLEGQFIREVLLSEIGRPIRMMAFQPDDRIPFYNDALVVSFDNEFADYLAEAKKRGMRNIGLFHMADELGQHDRGFYANADYVLRHYWFKDALKAPNAQSLGAVWVPNGYRTGVGPMAPQTLLGVSDRSIMGFFAGALKGRTLIEEREQMMRAVHGADLPFAMIETPGFAQGMGPVSYAAFMASSRFALIPAGNSPETIRLYDALEAGAIPVMLKSAFVEAKDALDNPPFVLLDAWSELPAAYAPYADAKNPAVIAALERKQRDVMEWWAKFKIAQQRKVRELIDRSFARAKG